MNILHGLAGLSQLPGGSILSIGNYDGVHRGHAALLSLMRSLRQSAGGRMTVVTFEPHPLTVLRPEKAPPRLAPVSLKRERLAELGVDHLIELAPANDVLNLAAEDFWAILRDRVKPSHLVEGSEFNFGKGRGGTIARLRQWTENSPTRLHVVEQVEVPLSDMQLAPISSTVTRWLVAYGRMRDVALCLGRPYALRGNVIKGHQRGRQMGVETANLQCDEQLVPCDGVYAGRCTIAGSTYAAAVSIGNLPTFGDSDRQIEAHLISYEGDLYGQLLDVELTDWLRDQRKYATVESLVAQIKLDLSETTRRLHDEPSRPIGAESAVSV